MNIYSTYIFCTKEVHELPDTFTLEIADILNNVKDNHVFFGQGVVEDITIDELKDVYNSPYQMLSFNDIFQLCERIRKRNAFIPQKSFVVILTNKENEQGWFSTNDGKNIYINVKDLELYSYNHTRYPISYQILENIFQAICGIVYNSETLDQRIHAKPIGCINDMCRQKSEIIRKLKEGKICKECEDFALQNGMTKQELGIFSEMLKSIKNPAIIRLRKNDHDVISIEVNENGELIINGNVIELRPLLRAFYIFFLQKEESIHLIDLKEYVKNIAKLYQKIKHEGELKYKLSAENIERIRTKVVSSSNYQKNTEFSKVVTEINGILDNSIDPDIVSVLHLKSDGSSNYSIAYDKSKVKIDEAFLLSN